MRRPMSAAVADGSTAMVLAPRRQEVGPQDRGHRDRARARRLPLGRDERLNEHPLRLVRRKPGGRDLHHAPGHRRSRVDPRHNFARHRHGRPKSEAPSCATLACGSNPRTSVWRQACTPRPGAWSSSRPSATARHGARVAAATVWSRPLRLAADPDQGAPSPALVRSSDEPFGSSRSKRS